MTRVSDRRASASTSGHTGPECPRRAGEFRGAVADDKPVGDPTAPVLHLFTWMGNVGALGNEAFQLDKAAESDA
ncbi:hypothetical protein [Streptomyces sp. NPDC127119]|uniref:hypothetical protein n=1 Tax=Streptomyces sp. NPDC127119 TaxID=3345370 RepID=UPI003638072E